MRLHANHVSVGESGGEYFQVSFGSEAPSDDDFDLSGPDHPYLVVQRQFEDDDGGVCYIETHDHDTYTGHFRELSRNLGDENRLKAAYRGGCRALPEPPERSNTPCREIPQSFLSVSLMLSKIP